jgi:alpha-L-fucosidase
VFSLGLPAAESNLEIRTPIESKVKRVSVVGNDTDLKWSVADKKLTLTTPPSSQMDELATVFKVEFE